MLHSRINARISRLACLGMKLVPRRITAAALASLTEHRGSALTELDIGCNSAELLTAEAFDSLSRCRALCPTHKSPHHACARRFSDGGFRQTDKNKASRARDSHDTTRSRTPTPEPLIRDRRPPHIQNRSVCCALLMPVLPHGLGNTGIPRTVECRQCFPRAVGGQEQSCECERERSYPCHRRFCCGRHGDQLHSTSDFSD
jgi:hypothetical protein